MTPHPRLPIARRAALAALVFTLLLSPRADVPQVISYQGRVAVDGLPFTGAGSFKFSLIRPATGSSVWSNDGTHPDGTEPDASVALGVANGMFMVLLGDVPLMNPFPVAVFENFTDLQLRVWFNDGTHGFEQLQPDTRLASAPYALNATVSAGSITAAKLAPASVGPDKLLVPVAPAVGQVLGFDGAGLTWMAAPGGGGSLSLPFSGTGATASCLFSIDNTGADDAWAIFGHSRNSLGVFGQTHGVSAGVLGRNESSGGQAVFGYASDAAVGALGYSVNAEGVVGVTKSELKAGVVGLNDADPWPVLLSDYGAGVYGYSRNFADGVRGTSEHGNGVFGRANSAGACGGRFVSYGGGVALRAEGTTLLNGATHLNNNNLLLRSTSDTMHGVGWYGAGKTWAGVEYDGPVLFGWAGGALGTTRDGPKSALWWDDTGMVSVKVLRITGGADLAEPFPMAEDKLEPGSVVVIDEERTGRLKLSSTAYDTRVAGIISGANGINPGLSLYQHGALEGSQEVALTGRVYAKADATSAPIRPGDLLTTSDTPGYAMKAGDHQRAQGAVLGKAMSGLPSGKGLILVLVTLQ